jgi:GT2 family glycosyltransferase
VGNEIIHVIILNWNGREVIVPCIESLRRISRPRLDIIVVDNGSTDGSADIVRERFPEVELIENGENLLFARGNNIGIERALEKGGNHILLLNNDTEVDEDFAEAMIGPFEDRSVGIVGPKIYYHDDPERIWFGGGEFVPLLGIPRHRNIRKLEGSVSQGDPMTQWVSGCAMLIRRKVIEEIGMLDPSYKIYCEDVDFCLRAKGAGWKIRYESRAVVWHKVSSSSGGGMTPFKLENRLASTWKLFSRYRSWFWRISIFPLHLVGFTGLLVGFILCGRFDLLVGAVRGAARILRSH